MLQGVLIDEMIEVPFQLACDFGGAPGAWAVDETLRTLMRKTIDPLAQGRIGKLERVGDGLQTLPLTTLRTAWARRKTRASLVCFKKVSKVGRASSGKRSFRVRI